MFIACGIAFNHESERRSPEFVTRKITLTLANIKAGLVDSLVLGNLNTERDWSYAPDIVQGAWLMLQQRDPDDFVLASGEAHSVREFAELAFKSAGVPIEGRIKQSLDLMRPTDIKWLVGIPDKAKQILGWRPQVGFQDMITRMVSHDITIVERHHPVRTS